MRKMMATFNILLEKMLLVRLGFRLYVINNLPSAVVPNLGPPYVLGLQLPEILASRGGGEGFWDVVVQEHLEAQGWGPLL